MTPDEFACEMFAIADDSKREPEVAHSEADDLLCELLRELGYEKGVDIFDAMVKW